MIRKIISLNLAAVCITLLASCHENAFGTVDLTIPDPDPVYNEYVYNHPCAMYSQADFDRVKGMLENGTAPQAVKEEFQNLKNTRYTVLPYTPSPTTQIVRGDATGTIGGTENYSNAMRDATAAYQMALIWKLSGDINYAESAIGVLNAWATTCKEVISNDANHMLAAGCQGYTFANAAEILQTYEGWNANELANFKTWMVEVFATKNRQFMDYHWYKGNTSCAYHYWANWDLVNMCSYLSIGILTEDDDMVNYVVNYFYSGVGNGSIKHFIQGWHTDPLGTGETICQNQESGRDQGHATMSAMVIANLSQMAYTLYQMNPTIAELDFFAANDNEIMKMAEYTALFNLKDGTDSANGTGSWLVSQARMPFTPYKYCIGCSCTGNHGVEQTVVADDSGRGAPRPGWEIIYNHYAHVKGVNNGYIYTKKFADKLRPEGGTGDDRYGTNSGAFDQLGWGTLMMYRE